MRERPILFRGDMVRAILSGQKTQTRRVAKGVMAVHTRTGEALADIDSAGPRVPCPFGQPGDRLWVRETWTNAWDEGKNQWSAPERYHYRADGIEVAHLDGMERSPWIPSIHMPRQACRLVLEITAVRVERLHEISESDAIAEGADENVLADIRLPRTHARAGLPMVYADCREVFADLWDTTGGDWGSNPWVWVIEFKPVEAP